MHKGIYTLNKKKELNVAECEDLAQASETIVHVPAHAGIIYA